jgi:ribosome maturation protein SDO1
MSRQINTPVNQVKLTNVAVVRYNHGGNRFEIACYRNKVMDYRAGLETDLSEVLQTDRIFTNVSKGQFAATADLLTAFQTTDEEAICHIILEKGSSLQVSDLERNQMFEQTLQQIAVWVASNCVHPETGRPYTVSQIRHALGKNYAVQAHKAIKKQYLDAVKFLKTVIDIERAKMELSLQYPASAQSSVTAALENLPHRVVSTTTTTTTSTGATESDTDTGAETTVLVLHVDPSLYRDLNELSKQVKGARMEIMQQVVAQEGDVNLDQEIERKKQQLERKKQQDQQYGTTEGSSSSNGKAGVPHNNNNNNNHDDDSDESDDDAPLVEKLAAVRLQVEEEEHEHGGVDQDDAGENDSSDDDFAQNTRRQNQKKNQKKSKKAKRREKEESAERQARIDAEKKRKEERFDNQASSNPASVANAEQQDQQSAASTAKSCNTCGGSFANAAEYRAHFRSDWHRFNQKLKLKSIAPVSEQEFLICDAETFFG